MKSARSVFVLLLLLLFGISIVLPAEDVSATPYDESETLPYESAPPVSIAVEHASARAAQAKLSYDCLLSVTTLTKRCRPSATNAETRDIMNPLTLLSHSLRC